MKTYYFTVTGTKFRYGQSFIEKGMKLTLEKEPDNEHDKEAIKVCLKPLGCIGYVANSSGTVIGDDCMSAGRLYDKIPDSIEAEVLFVLDKGIICMVEVENQEDEIARDKERL